MVCQPDQDVLNSTHGCILSNLPALDPSLVLSAAITETGKSIIGLRKTKRQHCLQRRQNLPEDKSALVGCPSPARPGRRPGSIAYTS